MEKLQILVNYIPLCLIVITALLLALSYKINKQQAQLVRNELLTEQLIRQVQQQMEQQQLWQQQTQHLINTSLQDGLIQQLQKLQESLQHGITTLSQQVTSSLQHNIKLISESMDKLSQQTEQRLQHISGVVDERLSKGFEKTTATFADVIKRLALIDEAQKKITELSTNVVSLQSILQDKSSRGTFGEVQLSSLIRNMLPEHHFSMQHTLSNGKRADCILFLPEPSGNIVIDSKFPLENYRRLVSLESQPQERKIVEQLFKKNIKQHIDDIASKYIISNETAEGAIMFIPAEAIFADIHAHYPDLVEYAHQQHVWITSPTTMMAIITTARAVLKDAQTRKQVHIIQEHLGLLAKDFGRFQQRMDKLARHIDQAHEDVAEVNTSARKISNRFEKIERVDIAEIEPSDLQTLEDTAI